MPGRRIANLAAQVPKGLSGPLIAPVQFQNAGHLPHRFERILRNCCTLQPGVHVSGFDLQHGSKVAAGTGTLSCPCGLHTPLHQYRDLLVKGRSPVTLFHH
jgi:hypothetical protein